MIANAQYNGSVWMQLRMDFSIVPSSSLATPDACKLMLFTNTQYKQLKQSTLFKKIVETKKFFNICLQTFVFSSCILN